MGIDPVDAVTPMWDAEDVAMKAEVNTERTVSEIVELQRNEFLQANPEYQRTSVSVLK